MSEQNTDTTPTLRDQFAKAAMQTLANGDYRSWENLADDSFRLADAMMKRRVQG